jgi:hypothetical protein
MIRRALGGASGSSQELKTKAALMTDLCEAPKQLMQASA